MSGSAGPPGFDAALAELAEAHKREVSKLANEIVRLQKASLPALDKTDGQGKHDAKDHTNGHAAAVPPSSSLKIVALDDSDEEAQLPGTCWRSAEDNQAAPARISGFKVGRPASPTQEFHDVVPKHSAESDLSYPPPIEDLSDPPPKDRKSTASLVSARNSAGSVASLASARTSTGSVGSLHSTESTHIPAQWTQVVLDGGVIPDPDSASQINKVFCSGSRLSLGETLGMSVEFRSMFNTLALFTASDMRVVFTAWSQFTSLAHSNIVFTISPAFKELRSAVSIIPPSSFIPMAQFNSFGARMSRMSQTQRPGRSYCSSIFHAMFIRPHSPRRTFWDICGGFLLGLDVILIPMSAFTSTDSTFWIYLSWVTLLFWTGDMAASCFTGYIHKGITIMTPRLIVLNYAKTWFFFDLIVVGPDWVFTLAQSISGKIFDSGSTSNFVRALRIARISRILRLVKFKRVISMVRDRIDSEKVFILANIAKLIVAVLMVTHFMAATWYAVGDQISENDLNWIDQADFRHKSLGQRYTVSYHWTLTQFTPGSIDLQPYSVPERIYNICVLVFGLVLFSSFISSITASMNRLQDIESNHSTQLWLLRRYLRQNKVTNKLSWRILRYVEYGIVEQKDRVSASKVWVLGILSTPLRRELSYAVEFSCLNSHHLFRACHKISQPCIVKLTENALTEQALANNDNLFHPGLTCSTMFMLQTGELGYQHFLDTEVALDDVLEFEDWACEATLWIDEWYTLGSLTAMTESKVICIHSENFRKVVQENMTVKDLCSEYAEAFVSWLNETSFASLSDIFKASGQGRICMQFLGQEYSSEDKRKRGSQRLSQRLSFLH